MILFLDLQFLTFYIKTISFLFMDITKYDADIQKAINNFIELAKEKKDSIKNQLMQIENELEQVKNEIKG